MTIMIITHPSGVELTCLRIFDKRYVITLFFLTSDVVHKFRKTFLLFEGFGEIFSSVLGIIDDRISVSGPGQTF